jgi:transglutaminase-like putative cysteine protease
MSRPSRLRLTLRDLGAAAAFASMAVSGQLPVWALGLFSVALVLALLNRRVLAQRAKLTGVLLLGFAAVLVLSVSAGQVDMVVAACAFAGLISAQRLLSTPDARTDGQVQLSGLLMVAGGAALSGDLIFAPCLIAFAVLASLSMGLAVVEAAVPEGEPVPVRAVMRPLALGVGFAVLGAMAFFILFPRVNWSLAARRTTPGLGGAASGFSDTVKLGVGSGTLKNDPRVVVRATLSPDPGTETLGAYWQGRTYDTFDGQEWTSIGPAKRARNRVTLRPGGDNPIHQRIELLPAYGSHTLVALETPIRMGNAVAHSATGSRRATLQELGGGEVRFVDKAVAYSYEAYSLPPDEEGSALPQTQAERDQLLALPENLDPRVAELAKRVLAGEREPLLAAQKLAAYLQREYTYTLELSGEVGEPLSDFLFERKAGHCEHFATALTVLLRTQGIAARLASGFYGGERSGAEYILRAGDAHAWTQVMVPDHGFATVDATPPSHRPSQSLAVLQYLTGLYSAVEARWRSSVVDFSIRDQLSMAQLIRPPRQRGEGRLRLPPMRAWLTALAAGAAVYALWRFLSRRVPSTRPHDATRFVDAVERQLLGVGLRRQQDETFEDLAARLKREGHPLAVPMDPVSRRYLEARFGGRPLQAGEAETLLRGLQQAVDTHRASTAARARAS